MAGIIWFLVFLVGALVLAYQRVSLLTATLVYGGALLLYAFTGAGLVSMIVLWVVLAGLVMLPQLGWMHPLALSGEIARPGLFGIGLGWGGPVSSILGHLIYGATMGSLYTRPVGHPAGQPIVAHG